MRAETAAAFRELRFRVGFSSRDVEIEEEHRHRSAFHFGEEHVVVLLGRTNAAASKVAELCYRLSILVDEDQDVVRLDVSGKEEDQDGRKRDEEDSWANR